jgi:membrane protease YdiL (CAAX protease family)
MGIKIRKKPAQARKLGRFRRRPTPEAMVSIFAALGPQLVFKLFLGCLGLMALGMVSWIVIFGEVPEPQALPPTHDFRLREVVLMFLAWLGIIALTEVGWQLALHETRVWGHQPIRLLWNAALVAFNALAILLVIDVFGLRLTGQDWSALGLRPISLVWIAGSIGLGLVGMVLSGAVAALVVRWQGGNWQNPQDGFLSPVEQSTTPSAATENAPADGQEPGAVRKRLSWLGALAMILLVGLLIPFVEELLFRGVLYHWLTESMSVWLAVPLSALAFGVAHWSAGRPVVVATAVMGILLALGYHYAHSLWAPVIMHAINNLAKVLVTYLVVE